MKEQIKNYIIEQCRKQGMEVIPPSETLEQLLICNEYAEVKVTPGHMDEMYFFEYWNIEMSHELLYRFPIPETLRGFMQVCNLLKIFHQ